jgi:hypothetical protein
MEKKCAYIYKGRKYGEKKQHFSKSVAFDNGQFYLPM